MESNNIITAPEVDGVHIFYEKWAQTHTGSMTAFYKFMTTPTPEREAFIISLGPDAVHLFNGKVVEVILRENQ